MIYKMAHLEHKTAEELLRMYLYHINMLKDVNQSLKEILMKFEYDDPSHQDIQNIDLKWPVGVDCIKELEEIHDAFGNKMVEPQLTT